MGKEARQLYDDAQAMIRELIDQKTLRCHGVIGLYPANSVGDDIEIYTDDSRTEVLATFHHLRQQGLKQNDKAYLCQSYFLAPKDSVVKDYMGSIAVTGGAGLDDIVQQYEADHNDYKSIMIKVIADRLAEGFAERMHERVRKEFWGYDPDENLTNDEIIHIKYRGIRPAPGYPACPDHSEKPLLFKLLNVQKEIGITLTESNAMHPASSVCGHYFAHPQASYFSLGKIAKDQVTDYAKRKGMTMAEVEKWLRPNLGY